MLAWLAANLINIVLILVIAAAVALILRGMIRDRRSGEPLAAAAVPPPGRLPRAADVQTIGNPYKHNKLVP